MKDIIKKINLETEFQAFNASKNFRDGALKKSMLSITGIIILESFLSIQQDKFEHASSLRFKFQIKSLIGLRSVSLLLKVCLHGTDLDYLNILGIGHTQNESLRTDHCTRGTHPNHLI